MRQILHDRINRPSLQHLEITRRYPRKAKEHSHRKVAVDFQSEGGMEIYFVLLLQNWSTKPNENWGKGWSSLASLVLVNHNHHFIQSEGGCIFIPVYIQKLSHKVNGEVGKVMLFTDYPSPC